MKQWKPLYLITLGHKQTDSNNQLIIIRTSTYKYELVILDLWIWIIWSHYLIDPIIRLIPLSDWSHSPIDPIIRLIPLSDWSHYPIDPIIQLIPLSDWSHYPIDPIIQLIPLSDWSHYPIDPIIRDPIKRHLL